MNDQMTTFGQLSAKFRNERNFRIADQAAALGVTTTEISSHELGNSVPSQDYIAKIARWLKLRNDEESRLIKSLRHPQVVDLASERLKRKEGVRLYRKIHKLSPSQIKLLADNKVI